VRQDCGFDFARLCETHAKTHMHTRVQTHLAKLFEFASACACACVRACARLHARVDVCACMHSWKRASSVQKFRAMRIHSSCRIRLVKGGRKEQSHTNMREIGADDHFLWNLQALARELKPAR
jgi:hypothetical protein